MRPGQRSQLLGERLEMEIERFSLWHEKRFVLIKVFAAPFCYSKGTRVVR